jgi:hypothetical protein
MLRNFSHNGKLYKKDEVLRVHGRFKKGDIDPAWADALIERGVARNHDKSKPKPADNKPVKK